MLMENSKLGPGHPATVQCLVHLATAYHLCGDFGKAGSLSREALNRARKSLGPHDPQTFRAMTGLGFALLRQRKWPEAEPVLRECLAVRQKHQSDAWATFSTRSQLGEALMGRGRYAEAEPLIVSGFEGMKAREATIPAPSKARLPDAADRIVALYEAWDKPEQAAAWKAKLGRADLPPDVFAPP
jgi:hypothetical protein